MHPREQLHLLQNGIVVILAVAITICFMKVQSKKSYEAMANPDPVSVRGESKRDMSVPYEDNTTTTVRTLVDHDDKTDVQIEALISKETKSQIINFLMCSPLFPYVFDT
uniref:Transmembrane protein n=1 Tax=Heterorhabditis bacteriophora TaxID=37862 RepID=A0A1I7XAA0_HETBA